MLNAFVSCILPIAILSLALTSKPTPLHLSPFLEDNQPPMWRIPPISPMLSALQHPLQDPSLSSPSVVAPLVHSPKMARRIDAVRPLDQAVLAMTSRNGSHQEVESPPPLSTSLPPVHHQHPLASIPCWPYSQCQCPCFTVVHRLITLSTRAQTFNHSTIACFHDSSHDCTTLQWAQM